MAHQGALRLDEVPNSALSTINRLDYSGYSGTIFFPYLNSIAKQNQISLPNKVSNSAKHGRNLQWPEEISRLNSRPAETNQFNPGGWTIENAKAKLHPFLMENRISADYIYSSHGPDHQK